MLTDRLSVKARALEAYRRWKEEDMRRLREDQERWLATVRARFLDRTLQVLGIDPAAASFRFPNPLSWEVEVEAPDADGSTFWLLVRRYGSDEALYVRVSCQSCGQPFYAYVSLDPLHLLENVGRALAEDTLCRDCQMRKDEKAARPADRLAEVLAEVLEEMGFQREQ